MQKLSRTANGARQLIHRFHHLIEEARADIASSSHGADLMAVKVHKRHVKQAQSYVDQGRYDKALRFLGQRYPVVYLAECHDHHDEAIKLASFAGKGGFRAVYLESEFTSEYRKGADHPSRSRSRIRRRYERINRGSPEDILKDEHWQLRNAGLKVLPLEASNFWDRNLDVNELVYGQDKPSTKFGFALRCGANLDMATTVARSFEGLSAVIVGSAHCDTVRDHPKVRDLTLDRLIPGPVIFDTVGDDDRSLPSENVIYLNFGDVGKLPKLTPQARTKNRWSRELAPRGRTRWEKEWTKKS